MLTFYRTPDCPRCNRIQEVMEELVLAHQGVVIPSGENQVTDLPAGTRLPVLVDDGEVIQGSTAILEHLDRLEAFKQLWDKFQSDACYCDEDEGLA